MNKLASIFYLQKEGFPTIDISIIPYNNVREKLKKVYFNFELGWAIRSAEKPDYSAKREDSMPWDTGRSFEELASIINELYHKVGHNNLVFIHPQRKLEKIGNLLILNDELVLEGVYGRGDIRNLTGLMRGTLNPEMTASYSRGMMRLKSLRGKNIFSIEELVQLREAERKLDSGNFYPAVIEFSFADNKLDIHDIDMRNT